MNKTEVKREQYCDFYLCKAFDYCKVKWGKDCTRHGGKKVPRLVGLRQHE